MKVEYEIIEDFNLLDLKKTVNIFLARGWECIGGITTLHEAETFPLFGRTKFYQSMIRKTDTSALNR